LTVQPGQALFSAIDVRARRAYWRGQPITHPFQVMVSPVDGQPIVLDANMLQVAILPRNIFKWLAALLILAILLAAAWFLLAKPAIDQAIQTAAQTATAQSAGAIADAKKAADSANKRLDAAGIPKDGAVVPAPKPSGKAPLVAPANFLLRASAANGQRNTTLPAGPSALTPVKNGVYTVPSVTLVNPQKDTGTFEVLVDGQLQWIGSLENTFDLKYAFDVPLVLSSDKNGNAIDGKAHSLAIRVNCTKAGDVPITLNGVKQGPGTCREFAAISYTSVTPAP
jgi:hypothetical protein